MADDQVLALKSLGLDQVCVLGVSQGGMIAQYFYERVFAFCTQKNYHLYKEHNVRRAFRILAGYRIVLTNVFI